MLTTKQRREFQICKKKPRNCRTAEKNPAEIMPGSQLPPASGIKGPGKESKLILGKYTLGHLIGFGASAKVYLACDIRTGQNVAIKCFSKQLIAESSLSNQIQREISVLRLLRHPHIVRLHEVLASRSKVYFVLQLLNGGDLFSRVARAGRLPEPLCRRYFHQLVAAVGYCHSRRVFHRDLKLENLLLDEHGDLKVSDFGLSAVPNQIRADGLFHTLCGTPAYVAPEILTKKGYRAAAVDLWSCGVILFVLAAGYLPFNDSNLIAMYRKVCRGIYRCPKWISPELNHLIGRLLDTNPETRITVQEIFYDPWFMKVIDGEKLTAMMKFHEEPMAAETSKAEAMDAEDRQLNAFDIIGFSSGFDLSGLFGLPSEREKFLSGEAPEAVLWRVEEGGRREGLAVSRKGEKGRAGVALRGRNGNLVVEVEIYRLTCELAVVEVLRGQAAEGSERWAGDFWREKPSGNRRTPVEDNLVDGVVKIL